jgi:acyl-CoA thioesterase I
MSARQPFAVACLLVALVLGCNRVDPPGADSVGPERGTASAALAPELDRELPADPSAVATRADAMRADAMPADATAADATGRPRVVFLGDSLTAGYGVAVEEAWPAVLGRLLEDEGLPLQVVNAGVSGDTRAGGLARTPWALRGGADILVVCLGGNDGLRGQPPASTAGNLRRIIALGREAGAQVLLVGVQLPPNYGPDYLREFAAVFPALAEETGVPLVPSLLLGIGGQPELNQADGIHPTAEGHRLAAENVLPQLRALLP